MRQLLQPSALNFFPPRFMSAILHPCPWNKEVILSPGLIWSGRGNVLTEPSSLAFHQCKQHTAILARCGVHIVQGLHFIHDLVTSFLSSRIGLNSCLKDSDKNPIILHVNQLVHWPISTFCQRHLLRLRSYLWWIHQLVFPLSCRIRLLVLLMKSWFWIFHWIKQWWSITTGSYHEVNIKIYRDNIKKAEGLWYCVNKWAGSQADTQEPRTGLLESGVIDGVAHHFIEKIQTRLDLDNYKPSHRIIYSRRDRSSIFITHRCISQQCSS